MANFRSDSLDRLISAILTLKNKEECYAFFEDLCTIRELKDISQRLDIAVYLHDGMNYQEVAAKTGVSSTTISRVKRSLEYGSGGYEIVIERMELET